jgi:hypothetical protein
MLDLQFPDDVGRFERVEASRDKAEYSSEMVDVVARYVPPEEGEDEGHVLVSYTALDGQVEITDKFECDIGELSDSLEELVNYFESVAGDDL